MSSSSDAQRKLKALVTGMSGLIGSALRARLGDRYEFSALNRSAIAGIPCHQADIADLNAILPAFAGVDVVVHLAANADMGAPWEAILHANVIGAYNVFEAARQAGVRRVVFASSGATVSGRERAQPYKALVEGDYAAAGDAWPAVTHEMATWPSGLYGASKVWGEAIGRHFADSSDLSVLCLRIGHVTAEDRPLSVRDYSSWCSQRDIVDMVDRCIQAPAGLKYDIFFVLSDNRWGYRDLAHGREVLGFVPQDAAENYRV